MSITRNKIVFCFLFAIYLPFLSFSQEKNINFSQAKSWKAIMHDARVSGKYIFVDCYASWCGPCKLMDDSIFTNRQVADFYNKKFIASRVQLDSSKNDSDSVRARYELAKYFSRKYKISEFPSFLFFSPDGQLVAKSIGYRNESDFLSIGRDALNPDKQYYVLLEKFKEGKVDSSAIFLARTTLMLADTPQAKIIAQTYIDVLAKSKIQEWQKPENISFMVEFSQKSMDPGFKLIYKHSAAVDKIMDDSIYAEKYVDYIIAKECIDPLLSEAAISRRESPNWDSSRKNIEQKFNLVYAERTIDMAKVRWYTWKQNWSELVKSRAVLVYDYSEYVSDFDLDVYAWDVFQHSTDTSELELAIGWIKRVLAHKPDWPEAVDTYANLVYKLGDKERGLVIEERAVKLNAADEAIQANFNKMKNGQPTW